MKKIALLVAMVIFNLNVFALTGNEFLRSTEERNGAFIDNYNGFLALGFLEGVTDRVFTSYAAQFGKYCPTGGVTNGQRLVIVKNYMKNHPEILDLPAEAIIAKAMNQSFPCFTFLEKFEKP